MYNAVKLFAIMILSAAVAVGCGSGNERRDQARALLDQARSYAEAGNHSAALAAIDSLNTAYRDCIDERKESTVLRLSSLYAITADSIESDEAESKVLQQYVDSLSPQFIDVTMPGTDGYKVAKSIFSNTALSSTSIQPRIDDKGYFFAVVNVQGRKIKLDRVSLGDVTATGRSIAVEGSELMNLDQESIAPLVQAIIDSAAPLTLTFSGEKGKTQVRIDARQQAAWRLTWQFAQYSQQLYQAHVRLEKYENRLALLKAQLDGIDNTQNP